MSCVSGTADTVIGQIIVVIPEQWSLLSYELNFLFMWSSLGLLTAPGSDDDNDDDSTTDH
jgi:hypothetical protein